MTSKQSAGVRLAALAIVAGALGSPMPQAVAAEGNDGVPQSPTAVTATTTSSGIRVSWAPAAPSNPPVTSYIVHAGPDSCPVTVPAAQTSAVMPFIKGPRSVVPMVQAVNDYGLSADAAGNAVTVPNRATPGYRNVQFLEFSDLHGAIEASNSSIGAPTLAAAFAADRRTVKSTFAVSAGDSIGGAPVISSEFAERPTIEALNLMGLDVSTLGNHEHDRPLSHLRTMVDLSTFPWVVSDYNTLAPLAGRKQAVLPSIVIERGGVKVGFIGLNTADLRDRVSPENLKYRARGALAIDDRPRVIQAQVDAVTAQGAQLVVALTHRGWDANVGGAATGPLIDAATRLRGVDLVYGGDSHQQYGSLLRGVPVVQVPNSGVMYSRTVLCLDTRTNRPIGSSIDFVTRDDVKGLTPDAATTAMVARYRAALGAKLDVRVGVVDGVFPRGGNPPVERSGQTPMGDFAADAIREKYGTDFGFINGGGIRDRLPANGYQPQDASLRRPGDGRTAPYDVTLGDVVAVFPFGNNVSTTTMTGAALWQALENGVSKWPNDGRFPQISGFRFSFDSTRPAGSRVLSVTRNDGTAIPRDDAKYSVATFDFMVNGGDGYTGVFSPTTAVMRDPLLDVVLERFKRDLTAGQVTRVPVNDGRIVNVSQRAAQ